jgi:hypothetical protein
MRTINDTQICEVSARCDAPATSTVYRAGRGWLPACGRCSGQVKSWPVRLFHQHNPLHTHKCPRGCGHGRAQETCGPCRCGAEQGTYQPQ